MAFTVTRVNILFVDNNRLEISIVLSVYIIQSLEAVEVNIALFEFSFRIQSHLHVCIVLLILFYDSFGIARIILFVDSPVIVTEQLSKIIYLIFISGKYKSADLWSKLFIVLPSAQVPLNTFERSLHIKAVLTDFDAIGIEFAEWHRWWEVALLFDGIIIDCHSFVNFYQMDWFLVFEFRIAIYKITGLSRDHQVNIIFYHVI